MSLLHKRDYFGIASPSELIPPRAISTRGTVPVTNETALRHSAVWAALRLRANLVSTMPVDAYRKVGKVQVEVAKPPILVSPGGDPIRLDAHEWLYATQFDLDRAGNCFGLITERNGWGLPARIDLQPLSACSVMVKNGKLTYQISGTTYQPDEVWHERQYVVAGLPVGLSPVAYAAWSVGEYLSIQDFALDWFGGGGVPKAMLRNTQKTVSPKEAATVKERFKAAVRAGDLFVTGADWEYSMLSADQAGSAWLEAKGASNVDIARFFDVPGDLIDAAVKGEAITYANIAQRNLQLLIMNLGPAVIRREHALTKLTPAPRYVKLNTNALLRMDPATQIDMFAKQITSRQLAPSETRELLDRPPFTDSQLEEFDRLFGKPGAKQAPAKEPLTKPKQAEPELQEV